MVVTMQDDFNNVDRIAQVLQLMKAGDNGRQAYKADKTRRDNPYPAHTALHEQWDTSFCQALHDDIPNIAVEKVIQTL